MRRLRSVRPEEPTPVPVPSPADPPEKRPLGIRPVDSQRMIRTSPMLTKSEVGRAIRRVVLDHTGERYVPEKEGSSMSGLARTLWTLLVLGIIAVGAVANRPSEQETQTIKTYPLNGK